LVACSRDGRQCSGGAVASAGNASARCLSDCWSRRDRSRRRPPRARRPRVGQKTAASEYAVEAGEDFRCRCRLRASRGDEASTTRAPATALFADPRVSERLPTSAGGTRRRLSGFSAGQARARSFVGLAVLASVSEAAEAAALLCCVDDAQWLTTHRPKRSLVVAHRLAGQTRIALAFATRTWAVDWPASRSSREPVGPPGAGRCWRTVPRRGTDDSCSRRIIAETGGNPLAVLELPRGLHRRPARRRFRGLPGGVPLYHWDRAEPHAGRAGFPRDASAVAASCGGGTGRRPLHLLWRAVRSSLGSGDGALAVESERPC